MDVDNGLTNFGYEGFQPPFETVSEARFMKAGCIAKNLANTLVRREDFQTGDPAGGRPTLARRLGPSSKPAPKPERSSAPDQLLGANPDKAMRTRIEMATPTAAIRVVISPISFKAEIHLDGT
jgi:hypothetical protein